MSSPVIIKTMDVIAAPTNLVIATPVKTNSDSVTPYVPPAKLSYTTMDAIVRKAYNYSETSNSTALDILAIYMRGQKALYTEAKTFCEQRLNALMLPAIFISAVCSVLSLVLQNYEMGPILISSLNACNSFILALISYLKLDAKAEAHKTAAYKFDKLQSYCEFNSGKLMFLDKDSEPSLEDMLKEIEANVKDIKDTNQFILPENIRYRFPIICSTNVFGLVKNIQNEEMILINRLKAVVNKIIDYNHSQPSDADKRELKILNDQQNSITEQLISYRNKYQNLDLTIRTEITEQIAVSKRQCTCCSWLKT